MSNLFHRAQKAMQERRNVSKESIRQALSGTGPKTAGLMFDLSQGEKGTTLGDTRRAHVKAIELVSSLLGSFSLPVRPQLEYHGMIKNATDNNGNISDGVIRVGAILHTLMGHKAHIEIPVIVRGRNLVEPALFFHDDAPYVMCGPALDDLIKRGSLNRPTQSRYIYSPPQDKISEGDQPREGITNHEHMFAPGARNPYNFRRQYSKTAQTDRQYPKVPENTAAWHFLDMLYQSLSPEELAEAGGLEHIEYGMTQNEDLTDQDKDMVREEVAQYLSMSKTSQHKGEPRKRTNIDVPTEFPELWVGDVEDEMLDPAERRRDKLFGIGSSVTLAEDAQVRDRGGSSLIIPKGESGKVVRDIEGDGKVLYVNFDKMNLTTSLPKRMFRGAGKIAVTAKQVNNEVKAMLREGYSQVDIKDAIQRRYPEQAGEALSSFDNG